METITALDGTLIPVAQILELRPNDGGFTVVTVAGRYPVSADAVHAILSKPPKRVTKKAAA